jgi:hypothetical protein
MKLITKIAAIATIHFGLTAGSLIGAVAVAANAVRDGVTDVGGFGGVLRESTRLLAQPATTAVLPHLTKQSIWMWPVLLLNSLLWASVLVLVLCVLSRKRNHAHT